jgi:hypothetical protein
MEALCRKNQSIWPENKSEKIGEKNVAAAARKGFKKDVKGGSGAGKTGTKDVKGRTGKREQLVRLIMAEQVQRNQAKNVKRIRKAD